MRGHEPSPLVVRAPIAHPSPPRPVAHAPIAHPAPPPPVAHTLIAHIAPFRHTRAPFPSFLRRQEPALAAGISPRPPAAQLSPLPQFIPPPLSNCEEGKAPHPSPNSSLPPSRGEVGGGWEVTNRPHWSRTPQSPTPLPLCQSRTPDRSPRSPSASRARPNRPPRSPSRHSCAPLRHSCAGRNPRTRRSAAQQRPYLEWTSVSRRPARHLRVRSRTSKAGARTAGSA